MTISYEVPISRSLLDDKSIDAPAIVAALAKKTATAEGYTGPWEAKIEGPYERRYDDVGVVHTFFLVRLAQALPG